MQRMFTTTTFRVMCICTIAAVSFHVAARPGIKPSSPTEDQMEAKLRASSLEIDHNCRPGLFKRAHLAASASARRYFWQGQRYAIVAEVQNQYSAIRVRALSDQADKEITVIEMRRDAVLGIPHTPIGPVLAQELAKTDRLLAKTDLQLLASTLQWAKRCSRVADDELQQAE